MGGMTRKIARPSWDALTVRDNCHFGPDCHPMADLLPGEVLEVETWDAYAGVITHEMTLERALERGPLPFKNPITGPFYVRGAEPGDVIVAEILDIKVADEGVTLVKPRSGIMKRKLEAKAITKFSEIEGRTAKFRLRDEATIPIPIRPFIGTVGVAPRRRMVPTTVPGRHGGNMDAQEVGPGSRLRLPVQVEGALFGLGDVHAVQGDGELCGTALEVPAVVSLRIDIEKGKKISWPMVEDEEEFMVICSHADLEKCIEAATIEMMKWLRVEYGLSHEDAYMLLSLVAKIRVAQVVNPLHTVALKLRKALLAPLRGGSIRTENRPSRSFPPSARLP